MSFAGEVRAELKDCTGRALHCKKAELIGIYEGCKKNTPSDIPDEIKNNFLIFTDSLTILQKCISLVKKAYREDAEVMTIDSHSVVSVGCSEIKELYEPAGFIERDCCKRAYLRGWFLAAGTVTDPEGHYDLEIVTDSHEQALHISEFMEQYGILAKLHNRKGSFVVYIREGQKVVDFLGIVGAHTALMKFENARIVKEVRAGINRQVNCETANIQKTISASARQIEDIVYLRDNYGFEKLSDNLAEIARLRLSFPDSSLVELGQRLKPPIGKSGVNHRLRRLSELAYELRDGGR